MTILHKMAVSYAILPLLDVTSVGFVWRRQIRTNKETFKQLTLRFVNQSHVIQFWLDYAKL